MTSNFFTQLRILCFDKVESTNTLAMNRLRTGEALNGDIIRANYQMDGKGQAQNRWYSSEGNNLLVSFTCVNLQIETSYLARFNMLVAIAIHKTISRYFPKVSSIKWPNDILVNDKKIAGILIETILQGDQIKHAVIGVGMNVNEQVFPMDHAVSFTQISGLYYNIDTLMHELTHQLGQELQKIHTSAFDAIKGDYERELYGMNLKRYFRTVNSKFEGTIRGVNEFGQLCLEVDGELKTFNQKEITFDFLGY